MTIAIARRVKHASLALIALSSVGGLQSALAVGTDAGVQINNRATVNYSVGGVTQTPIESSSTGNATAGVGAGADTTFVVDRRVFMAVADVAPSPTELSTTVPGGAAVVRRFTITNTSNKAIGFRFPAPTNLGGDQFDAANLTVRVDSVSQPNGSYAPGTYDSATDVATSVVSLPEDSSVTVYVLGDIPGTAVNGNTAIVNLQAIATEPSAPDNVGTVGADLVATAGVNTAGVDTVFGDAGNDGTESDTNVYTVSSASLTVAKTASVISDPFTGVSVNAKAIPGAVIEYAIAVANNGTADAAQVGVTDPIPTNTAIDLGGYAGQDIEIAVSGGATTTCTAASDADGCVVAAGVLTIAGASRPTIPATQTATIRFRVTIQ